MEFPFYSDMVDMKKRGDIDGFTYKFVVTFPPIIETNIQEVDRCLRPFCREFYSRMFLIQMFYKVSSPCSQRKKISSMYLHHTYEVSSISLNLFASNSVINKILYGGANFVLIALPRSGFYSNTFADIRFHEGLSFMTVDLNPMCQHVGHCNWRFICGAVSSPYGVQGVNAPGSFGYFTDFRFSNRLSMNDSVT